MRYYFFIVIFTFHFCPLAFNQTLEELDQKVTELFQKGDIEKAIEYQRELVYKAKTDSGKYHTSYIIAAFSLGLLLEKNNDYEGAESLFIEALEIKKKIHGESHPDFAGYFKYLGMFYKDRGNNEYAEDYYLKALKLIEKSLAGQHPDYAGILSNLGELYRGLQRYSQAETLLLKSIQITLQTYDTEHYDYAVAMNNLAALYNVTGKYKKAEEIYLEVLKIREITSETNPSDFALTLNNLANLYISIGNYDSAEPLLYKVLEIIKNKFGMNHVDYALALGNLGLLCVNQGKYQEADLFYQQSIELFGELEGKSSRNYISSLTGLAGFYQSLGNYSKSEILYQEAMETTKNTYGTNTYDFALIVNNLAHLYSEMGNFTEAEHLFITALGVWEETLGKFHPNYSVTLDNLAYIYNITKDHARSEKYSLESIEIIKNTLGKEHPEYATSINNLAVLYRNMGHFEKAEPLYIEAHQLTERILGTDHPDYLNSLNNFFVFYLFVRDYDAAEPYYIKASQKLNNQINNSFRFLAERERELFLSNKINPYSDLYNSFVLRRKEINPAIVSLSYNHTLAHKGMLLLSNTALRKAIYESSDPELINDFNRFVEIHQDLASLYNTPSSIRKENLDSLENMANNLERELIRKGREIPGVENFTRLTTIDWQDVSNSLQPHEAAIEFIHFNNYDRIFTDSIIYCALVLTKDNTYPQMVYLFNENQLSDLILSPEASSNPYYIKQIYSSNPDTRVSPLLKPNKNVIFDQVWKNIDDLLEGIKTVHIAPSGLLHKISFSSIPVNDSVLLSDKYRINQVSSTRVLTQERRGKQLLTGAEKAVLFGGIEYDIDSADHIHVVSQFRNQKRELSVSQNIALPALTRGMSWSFLPGTLDEVSNIQTKLNQNRIISELYTGKLATEEVFKNLSEGRKSPEIIHIATHGFYIPEDLAATDSNSEISQRDVIDFGQLENPLLRSGLLMSGAGRKWNNLEPIPEIEDGLLTAYEVSNLNLSNTSLVVLSACETGLGEIKGTEGVYGFQRGFKMAGVNYLIISLWQVPDQHTSEMMKLLYGNLLSGKTIAEGFRLAQQTMRHKYEPFYWGGFLLME